MFSVIYRNTASKLNRFVLSSPISMQHQQRRPITVLVEGNIASGKTTMINWFVQNKPDTIVVTEPVDEWRNVDGEHNLLQANYEDPKRNCFTLQMYALLTNFRNQTEIGHDAALEQRLKIMERSVFSGRYVFVKSLHDNGIMNSREHSVFVSYFDTLMATHDKLMHTDLIVYLRTDPTECLKRLMRRSKVTRVEEAAVSLEYLQQLHDAHERWLGDEQCSDFAPFNTQSGCKRLIIDVDADLSNMEQWYHHVADTMTGMQREAGRKYVNVNSPVKSA